jgi:hypothetical protein
MKRWQAGNEMADLNFVNTRVGRGIERRTLTAVLRPRNEKYGNWAYTPQVKGLVMGVLLQADILGRQYGVEYDRRSN